MYRFDDDDVLELIVFLILHKRYEGAAASLSSSCKVTLLIHSDNNEFKPVERPYPEDLFAGKVHSRIEKIEPATIIDERI